MARLKLIDENDELAEIRKQIYKRMNGIPESIGVFDPENLLERETIKIGIHVPSSCKECAFRLNDSREHWKCFLVRTIRNTPHYILKTVADDKRADFCPFDKRGEKNE